tara:strand:- start:228 stop:818 length:591 start_codon:yes stop_codon:yes gene_type:complete
MMIHTIPLFTINVYKTKIKDWSEKHRDRLLDLVPKESSRKLVQPGQWTDSMDYTDYHAWSNQAVEKPPYYDELMKVLKPYLEEFFSSGNYKSSYQNTGTTQIHEVWCQRYKSGDYHSPHDHGSIGYSAVLYAKLDPDVHRSTEFYMPFPTEQGSKRSQSLMVEEGDLVIFPAHLLHMAPPHCSEDKIRVIFSFNFF